MIYQSSNNNFNLKILKLWHHTPYFCQVWYLTYYIIFGSPYLWRISLFGDYLFDRIIYLFLTSTSREVCPIRNCFVFKASLRKRRKVMMVPNFTVLSDAFKYAMILLYYPMKPNTNIDTERLGSTILNLKCTNYFI